MSQTLSEFQDGSEGFLSSDEIKLTVSYLCNLQLDTGMIPWYEGGHADPWNHTEALIALAMKGELEAAVAGLRWLCGVQNKDGSLCQYFLTIGVEEPRRDLNTCAYVAMGFLACLSAGMYQNTALELWPSIAAAVDFVVEFQLPSGAFPWAVDPGGYVYGSSLLTGCSSIFSSLDAAVIAGEMLGVRTRHWAQARDRLAIAIRSCLGDASLFEDKSDWAMDGYYPSLVGALEPSDARARLRGMLPARVVPGWGVLCVSSSAWTTAAETSEMAAALALNSSPIQARSLLALTQRYRDSDGSYFTGFAYESGRTFPGHERSSYTAAAVLIADAILTSGLRCSLADAIGSICSRSSE